MLKVYDLMKYIEEIAPSEKALSFDNVGLMTGSRDKEVTGILCCLDLTREVIYEAVEEGVNTIITHHPFIFDPVKRLDEDNVRGKLLGMAVRYELNVLSAHTNWDFAEKGVNHALCVKIGLKDIREDEYMQHRFGVLDKEMDISEFCEHVKDRLQAKFVKVVIPEGLERKKIKVVGVSCGSFDGESAWIYENGVDCLVTGEVKHSQAIDLNMHGFVTISAGHYETEVWGMDAMADIISKRFGDKTRILKSVRQKNPFILR